MLQLSRESDRRPAALVASCNSRCLEALKSNVYYDFTAPGHRVLRSIANSYLRLWGRACRGCHVARSDPTADGPSSEAEVRAALARLIASGALGKSGQLAHFLTYVVEEALAGRAERIKAYTIAVDALGRDTRFDPQADPIVRVEAGRLRRALESYYAAAGRDEPIVIELPRGSYIPAFQRNTARYRAIARAQGLRRKAVDLLRANYRLLLLIVVIAAIVSLVLDIAEMLIEKLF